MTEEQLSSWKDSLQAIMESIARLRRWQRLYRKAHRIVRNNPAVSAPNPYWGYLGETYASAMVIGLTRQIDRDPRSHSLRNLLSDLHRGGFRSESRKIDSLAIEMDIKSLVEKGRTLKEYRDKWLAHHDKVGPQQLPKFEDINEFLSYIDSLVDRYWPAVYGSMRPVTLFEFPFGWEDIFRKPWMR